MCHRRTHENKDEHKQEVEDSRQAVCHDLDDVRHHWNVAEVLEHFDPGDDTVECKNVFPQHYVESRIVV